MSALAFLLGVFVGLVFQGVWICIADLLEIYREDKP